MIVGIKTYRLHFFRPFLVVSFRFGSSLKQPYFVTHFNLKFDCSPVIVSTVPPLVFASIFAFASMNPPAIQAYYEIAFFPLTACKGFFVVVPFLCKALEIPQ